VDVCVAETWKPNWLIVVEVCRKKGKFDEQERWTINIRNWPMSQKTYHDESETLREVKEGSFSIHQSGNTIWMSASWESSGWSQSFQQLKCDLEGYDLPSIVIWHWRRYYSFLDFPEVRTLADSFPSLHPEIQGKTLAEANRMASRDLYHLARQLGWKKLTAREQQKHGIDAMWIRQERIMSGGNQTGCGQYTEEAARGLEIHPIPEE
jgi:hypothetical protein